MSQQPSFPRDDADALDEIGLPAPGTVRRGMLRFSQPALADYAWPYAVVRGASDGPRLALISGVHPAEYPAIEANIRVTRALDPAQLRGTVVSLPLIDVPAFLPRTPFVCPIDGKNPNRFFPGDPNGTFTDVMDDAIFRAVIAPSDALIDLHGGDMVEALMPFTIYSGAGDEATRQRSSALGRAIGLPYLVESRPAPGAIAGTTAHAAAAAGIPSVVAEAGSSGLLTEPETQMLVDGVGNALRHLGMAPGRETPQTPAAVTRFTWLNAPAAGMWHPEVGVGERVREGQRLGRIENLWGDEIGSIVAPHAGVILFFTSAPAMRQDGICIAVGGA
ncbi:MAG TPA: succinylglutamate desuccinylase/aspartoacylase family protein [Thermomicrobiales bacterium]|nr:succinylglutamate desuccinylase/aspartoacylase family protein [Thermomicrobiales bacterium]